MRAQLHPSSLHPLALFNASLHHSVRFHPTTRASPPFLACIIAPALPSFPPPAPDHPTIPALLHPPTHHSLRLRHPTIPAFARVHYCTRPPIIPSACTRPPDHPRIRSCIIAPALPSFPPPAPDHPTIPAFARVHYCTRRPITDALLICVCF
ncbi:hypothetical protein B0H13DRAFT_2315923 [Mycena leptocephala]|nr:hypothetical protein B0H13DRAFT_2368562 [Mycena leptocephala]KAJ7923919.1 hypothetical protein B0H13DRAFT_2315923 [Mycena leptocephala]